MAEETPGNLGAMFGGWMTGRAAGNRKLDESIDRLDATINKLTDALGRIAAQTNSQKGSVGGTAQSASPRGNGGGATFNGQPAG